MMICGLLTNPPTDVLNNHYFRLAIQFSLRLVSPAKICFIAVQLESVTRSIEKWKLHKSINFPNRVASQKLIISTFIEHGSRYNVISAALIFNHKNEEKNCATTGNRRNIFGSLNLHL